MSETGSYSYYRDILRGERMPCAFVDLDAFDENVTEIAKRSKGRPIRVASKSVRNVSLLRRIFEADPIYQGIMTYTPAETRFFCDEGFDDFLMGYPCWRDADIAALCEPIRQGKTVRFMVDSVFHVEHLDAIGKQQDTVIQACIDLDMSSAFPGIYFGVNRSPVKTPEQALEIANRARELDHVVVDALMGYEAQIAGLPDSVPGQGVMNTLIRYMKKKSIKEIADRRTKVVSALNEAGHELAVVNGGGTGSIESTIVEEHVTEVTVGSGFFTPVLFDSYMHFRHRPSVGYAIEIVRQPKPDTYTCQGGGYTASGSIGADKGPQPYLPVGAKLIGQEGAGEVQTPIVYDGPETLALGDPILMRYSKAGEMCERFNELIAISEGKIVDRYPTYRGMGQVFC